MSASETMKNHMDAVRGVTGVSGLLSMAMATDALNDAQGGLLPSEKVFFTDQSSIDNVVEQGNYMASGASPTTSKNAGIPGQQKNGWGTLVVLKNSYYVMQFWLDTQYGAGNNVPFFIYYRAKNWKDNTKWSPWNKIGGGN